MTCIFCSHGYAPFFQAIQPQLNSLRTFLMQQSKTLPPSSVMAHKKTPPSVSSPASSANAALASTPVSSRKTSPANPVVDSSLSRPPTYKRSSTSPRLTFADERVSSPPAEASAEATATSDGSLSNTKNITARSLERVNCVETDDSKQVAAVRSSSESALDGLTAAADEQLMQEDGGGMGCILS